MSFRTMKLAGAAALGLTLLAGPAYAGNAHFIASKTNVSFVGTSLTVSFKEAGLESGSVETVTASAHLDATYQCINGGGNNPADPKKTTVSSDVATSGQFAADKNGNIVGQLTLTAPATTSALDCPGGQTQLLTAVTWSNLSLTDNTSGAYVSIPGTWSAGSPVGHGKG